MTNEPRFSSTDSLVIRGIWKSSIGVLTSSWCESSQPGPLRRVRVLLGVQLDDELLLHRRRDLTAFGLAQDLCGQAIVIGLQPCRHLSGQLSGIADHLLCRRPSL